MKTKNNYKIITKDIQGNENGFLLPIYNIHDNFFELGKEPQQVYLTVITPGHVKGPHLHFIRTGCFTCIKGNARFILKTENGYEVILSGEANNYRTVIVPTGIPAALQSLGDEEAYVLNMPNPAWTANMQDEHNADFSDFDFTLP
jgi:dTDP-4-dehydrorhamnose 3,5-epimerase-like enzyme